MSDARRSAIVTGGSSGIGLAVARALVERGWRVSICGRDEQKLERAAGELSASAAGDPVLAVPADVSRLEDVRRLVAAARERHGAPGLLVNNAGIGGFAEVADLSDEQWDRTIAVNLRSAFLCTREVLPMMREAGTGLVVNVASLAGKKGFAGAAAYCASKFGLVGFTESLCRENVRHGIRATAICPGYVATPMASGSDVPPAEMVQPEDVAKAVVWLLDLSPHAVVREIVLERSGAL